MKASLQNVRTLEAKLIGLEMELKLMINDLAVIRNNIAQLVQIEKRLTHNINFLKKEKIIANASEYRKSSIELSVTKDRLKTYCNLENAFADKILKAENMQEEFMEKYEKAKKRLENEKIILLFNPKKTKKTKK